ncbi:Myblike DNAbinding domain-containing protein, partial [Mortierella sp. AM989]
VEWYQKAAGQGNAAAQDNLGDMYYYGYSLNQDYSKAVEWYQKATNQGNASAQGNLGDMYRYGHGHLYQHGFGVDKDYSEAIKWYQKAANQGNADAQNNLGDMYYYGNSVSQDYPKAFEWYQKAASQGHVSSQNSLGYMYRYGHGVDQNYSKATEWYQKAAINVSLMTSPVLSAAASSMRRVLSVGSQVSKGVSSLYKSSMLHPLRISHTPSPHTPRSASYRFFPFSTIPNNITLGQEDELFSDHDSSSEESSESESDLPSESNKNTVKYKKPQFTPEIDQEIVRLHSLGKPWMTIGSTLGIPYRSCHRRFISTLDPALKDDWSEEKTKKMDVLVEEGKTWAEIAQILGTSITSCRMKWKYIVKPKGMSRNRIFDGLQNKVLLHLVEEYGEGDWNLIMRGFMMQLGGRDMAKVTPEQLRHQYLNLQRKSTIGWSLDDETALIQHVLKHGTEKWDELSEKLQAHSPEQCKEKWMGLDMKREVPKTKAWYKGERGSFWRLYLRHGRNFEVIASQLRKRTAANCEEFFNKQTAAFNKDDPEEFERNVQLLADKSVSLNTVHWKKEDSDRLWDVVENIKKSMRKRERVDWQVVANEMNLDMTQEQYKHHHYYLKVRQRGGLSGSWTSQEIEKLEKAVQEVGRDWVRVSREYLPHRNPKSLCHKYKKILYKGSFISPEEYETLMSNVDRQEKEFNKRQGKSSEAPAEGFTPDWRKIAKLMPTGVWTADQCRTAYQSSFKNHLKNSKWTPEEDNILLNAAQVLGRKNWIGIALKLPGKDTWECRLRWTELQDPILKDKDTPITLD